MTDAQNGSVFRLQGDRCVAIAEGWSRPYGVAVLDDGRVCVSHYTSDDPLTRETAVSCWDGAGWALEVRGLGSGVNGLAATPAGIWLAAWEDTPVESRNGVLLLVAGKRVTQEIRLEDGVPRFLAPRPDGGLLITVVRRTPRASRAAPSSTCRRTAGSSASRTPSSTCGHRLERPGHLGRRRPQRRTGAADRRWKEARPSPPRAGSVRVSP